MIRQFNFSFDELTIDQQEIRKVLGYDGESLPSPFDNYLEEAISYGSKLTDIHATQRLIEEVILDKTQSRILAAGNEFKIGKTVCNELQGSEQLAFFVCSAGKSISEKSALLLRGEDPVLGYVYDVLGTAIVEATGDLMQSHLKQEIEKEGKKITNRYSPGYCHWDVSDQHKLFSLFQDSPCGVSLTASALMFPVKSISGVIGIGQNVRYRTYQCTLCLSENCIYKKIIPHII